RGWRPARPGPPRSPKRASLRAISTRPVSHSFSASRRTRITMATMYAPPLNSGIPSDTWDNLSEADRERIEQTMREHAQVRAHATARYYEEMDSSGQGCPPWQNAPAHIRDHYLKLALYELQPRYVALPDAERERPRIVEATLEGHAR